MGRLNDIINEYAKSRPVRFHMPGHKGRAEIFQNNINYSADVTELFFTDNLYNPDCETNLIRGLENRIAKVFFDNPDIYSLISCSGATLCIQGSLLALVRLKQKQIKKASDLYIICDSASHISFINAIYLLNIKPIWIEPGENFEEKINFHAQSQKERENIVGVFVTSPDYFGQMKNIGCIAKECKKYSLNLIVDNSHGSHLAFYKNGSLHPVNSGADISVDSVHKTMPALTGAAILHSNSRFDKESLMRQSMKVFASTSPSYLILQSIDNMVDLLEEKGIAEHERLINDINLFRQKAESLGFIFETGEFYDPYRIVLDCENSGKKLYYFLAEKNIVCEFFDKDSIIIIPSISNYPDDFDKLFEGLYDFAKTNKIVSVKTKKQNFYPQGFLE